MNEELCYTKWSRKKFEELPRRNWNEKIKGVSAFVILPRKTRHDSGYREMDIVPIKGGKPLCRCGGCSDVLHLAGIGGYNRGKATRFPYDFSIDCLPVSGLLQVFMQNHTMNIDVDLSSLEIFCEDVQDEQNQYTQENDETNKI